MGGLGENPLLLGVVLASLATARGFPTGQSHHPFPARACFQRGHPRRPPHGREHGGSRRALGMWPQPCRCGARGKRRRNSPYMGGKNREEGVGGQKPNPKAELSQGTGASSGKEGGKARRHRNMQNARLEGEMLRAAGTRGHWHEAIVLFERMKVEGMSPTKAAYAAALRACAKGADWERAMQLFDNYMEEGFDMESTVVSAAVKACCRAGRPLEARRLLERGQALAASAGGGLDPPQEVQVPLYNAIMNSCLTIGDTDTILELSRHLQERSLQPDQVTYNLVVTSHITKQDWVGATRILVQMSAQGVVPSAKSTRQWRLVSEAVEEVEGEGEEDDPEGA